MNFIGNTLSRNLERKISDKNLALLNLSIGEMFIRRERKEIYLKL